MPELSTELQQELQLAVEDCGCDLVHAEFRGNRLQVMIENGDSTGIGDCERVSHRVSPLLDAWDFGDAEYVLEVTSPGLDRPLFGPRDYERFAGHLARVQWVQGDNKRTDQGLLGTFTPGDQEIELTNEQGQKLRIPVDAVLHARLEIEL